MACLKVIVIKILIIVLKNNNINNVSNNNINNTNNSNNSNNNNYNNKFTIMLKGHLSRPGSLHALMG